MRDEAGFAVSGREIAQLLSSTASGCLVGFAMKRRVSSSFVKQPSRGDRPIPLAWEQRKEGRGGGVGGGTHLEFAHDEMQRVLCSVLEEAGGAVATPTTCSGRRRNGAWYQYEHQQTATSVLNYSRLRKKRTHICRQAHGSGWKSLGCRTEALTSRYTGSYLLRPVWKIPISWEK